MPVPPVQGEGTAWRHSNEAVMSVSGPQGAESLQELAEQSVPVKELERLVEDLKNGR